MAKLVYFPFYHSEAILYLLTLTQFNITPRLYVRTEITKIVTVLKVLNHYSKARFGHKKSAFFRKKSKAFNNTIMVWEKRNQVSYFVTFKQFPLSILSSWVMEATTD